MPLSPSPSSPKILTITPPEPIVIPAISKHTATVILLHGLGDTGRGWSPIVDMFRKDKDLSHIKWILPNSPVRHVKANPDPEMPSWFDIFSFGLRAEEDEEGMLKSSALISRIIADEVTSGTPSSRIILGGFSQGGAMSLLVGLTGEHRLAGLAVLSGWLPLKARFKNMARKDAASIPIFWGYGLADRLVLPQVNTVASDFLVRDIGIRRTEDLGSRGLMSKPYEGMGHETDAQERKDLESFIKKIVP